jgi:hypothetical protein
MNKKENTIELEKRVKDLMENVRNVRNEDWLFFEDIYFENLTNLERMLGNIVDTYRVEDRTVYMLEEKENREMKEEKNVAKNKFAVSGQMFVDFTLYVEAENEKEAEEIGYEVYVRDLLEKYDDELEWSYEVEIGDVEEVGDEK